MESLYLLIPVSVVLVFLIGLIFWWSVRSGQFDDLEGPAYRILMDDDKSPPVLPPADTPTDAGRAGQKIEQEGAALQKKE